MELVKVEAPLRMAEKSSGYPMWREEERGKEGERPRESERESEIERDWRV